jgi:hypothetical protein
MNEIFPKKVCLVSYGICLESPKHNRTQVKFKKFLLKKKKHLG